jgi:hypothetical protein
MIIFGKSPNGSFWSSRPLTREQKASKIIWNHCEKYRKTYRILYEQIKSGSKENLRKWVRDWFIKIFEEQNI